MKFTIVLKTVIMFTIFLFSSPWSFAHGAENDDYLNVDLDSPRSASDSLAFFLKLEDTPPPDTRMAETWSIQTIRAAHANDLETAWKYYVELGKLAHANPGNVIIARRQGAAIVILSRVLAGEIDPIRKEDWSEALYRDISILTALHPKNSEIVLRQMETALTLSVIYRNTRKPDKITFLYEEADTIAKRHSKETRIIARAAEIAENAMIAYRDVGDFAKADQWYQTLAKLAEGSPKEREIALVQARAARELSSGYSATGDLEEAMPLYETTKRLAEAFPDDSRIVSRNDYAIQAQQAMTIPSLITVLLKSDRLPEAEALYEPLSELNSYDLDILLARAEAAGLLMNVYKKPDDREKIEELRDEVRQMVRDHPLETNRLARLSGMDELRRPAPAPAEEYPVEKPATLSEIRDVSHYEFKYVEAKEKLDATPTDAASILRVAEAMSALSRSYLDNDERAKARAMYARLLQFVREHPNNISVAREQMTAAVTLANDAEVTESEAFYKDARTLAESYPQDLALARWRSQAALNLAVVYMNAAKLIEIAAVSEDMKRGLRDHPDDAKIIYYLGDINRRMLIGYSDEASDLGAAADYWYEVMELTAPYTHDDDIVRIRAATLHDITVLYAKTGYWSEARKEFYSTLKKLVKTSAKSSWLGRDLAVLQATTASPLLSAALKDNQPAAAKEFYKDIAKLNVTYPNKTTDIHGTTLFTSYIAEIVMAQAQGAQELSSIYGNRGKTAEVAALYKDATRLLATFATERHFFSEDGKTADETRQIIAVRQAQIGKILVNAYRKDRQSAKATAVMKDIEKLAATWPENEHLRQIGQNMGRP